MGIALMAGSGLETMQGLQHGNFSRHGGDSKRKRQYAARYALHACLGAKKSFASGTMKIYHEPHSILRRSSAALTCEACDEQSCIRLEFPPAAGRTTDERRARRARR